MKKTNQVNQVINSVDFKVKRYWWMWIFGAAVHFIAVRIMLEDYSGLMFVVIIIIDVIILRDVSQVKYELNDKFLYVKHLLFSDTEITLSSILSVENYSLFKAPGFAVHINELHSALRITYKKGRIGSGKRAFILINPKNKAEFLDELGSRVDRSVILKNNTESAFKKRKDDIYK